MIAQLTQKHRLQRTMSWAPPKSSRSRLDFETVYREHAAFVTRSIGRLGVTPSNVEDAAQEVFVVVHRKLDSFAGRSSIRTWVFAICLRVAADWRRLDCRRRETSLEDVPELLRGAVADAADALQRIERRQARAVLETILEGLDPKQRAVFTLFEIEEWSMKEVADAVNCPLQTAYARLYAARRIVEASVALHHCIVC